MAIKGVLRPTYDVVGEVSMTCHGTFTGGRTAWLDTPVEPHFPTNCKNCGAGLHSTECEYCGTLYGNRPSFVNQVGRQMPFLVNGLNKEQTR